MPDVTYAVEAGRTAAESRMTDTCFITKPGTGEGTPNPVTLEIAPPPPVTVYEGKCRLGRVEIPTVAAAAAGEASWDTQDMVLHLPADADDVGPDMTVTYLTAAHNPALVGKQFGVIGVMDSSQATARRCRVREVVSV